MFPLIMEVAISNIFDVVLTKQYYIITLMQFSYNIPVNSSFPLGLFSDLFMVTISTQTSLNTLQANAHQKL